MKNVNLLIVDDDATLCELLAEHFSRKEFNVTCHQTGEEAAETAAQNEPDVGIIDIRLPGMSGTDLFRRIRETQPQFEAIILTGAGTVDNAIESMKLGVYDYITKPCKLFELEIIVRKAYEKKMLAMENLRLKGRLDLDKRDYTIVGESESIANLRKLVEKVASTTSPVLIKGEAGSGKAFTARAIHALSRAKDAPFITVACGMLPHGILENRLFGTSGDDVASVTGNSTGWLEIADGGTLFMADVEELHPSTQLKLHRYMETGVFQRVGGNASIRANVRIISGTQHDLREMVIKKNFREDLYYQLGVFTVEIPSLRERREDIPHLIDHLMKSNSHAAQGKTFSRKAINAILKYDWPGNIRELRNVVERAAILSSKNVVQAKDIPITIEEKSKNRKLRHLISLNEIEREHILYVLNAAGGNISRASRILGISRPKLYRKINLYSKGKGKPA